MKTRINTPDGPRIIPDWAKCHCVKTHRPAYVHPYPFALPDGTELWLCPNTYHQATTLLNMYNNLNGPPKNVALNFNYFVRSLLTMYWQQVLEARSNAEQLELWKQEKEERTAHVYSRLARTVAYE